MSVLRASWSPLLWTGLALFAFTACADDAATPALPADAGTSGPSDAAVASDAAFPGADAGISAFDAALAPDAGGVTDECNPVTQSGCDPSLTCVVEGGTPGTQCITPHPDPRMLGEDCMGRDCVMGLACIAVGTSTTGACGKVCDLATGDGCEPLGGDYDCLVRISGANWGICRELPALCNPYTQAECAPAQACQPYRRRSGTWEFRCRSGGPGAEAEPCSAAAACGRNLACVQELDGSAYCRRYCQGDGDCMGANRCAGSANEPPFMFCVP